MPRCRTTREPERYRHWYADELGPLLTCPRCARSLTTLDSLLCTFRQTIGLPYYGQGRLDEDGELLAEGVTEGFHCSTECAHCGENLADYEV